MPDPMASIHASAVLVGARAVLIRGPSGAGKSRLAAALLHWADGQAGRFARLIGDDRIHLEATANGLIARGAPVLAGRIELRGLGIAATPCEPFGLVGLVADLAAPDAARLPEAAALSVALAGIVLPRVPVAAGCDGIRAVIARCSWLGAAAGPVMMPQGQADP